MTGPVNGTQWMLEAAKELLADKLTAPRTRRLAAAVVELVAVARAATDERDGMAKRLQALIDEIDQSPVAFEDASGVIPRWIQFSSAGNPESPGVRARATGKVCYYRRRAHLVRIEDLPR